MFILYLFKQDYNIFLQVIILSRLLLSCVWQRQEAKHFEIVAFICINKCKSKSENTKPKPKKMTCLFQDTPYKVNIKIQWTTALEGFQCHQNSFIPKCFLATVSISSLKQ